MSKELKKSMMTMTHKREHTNTEPGTKETNRKSEVEKCNNYPWKNERLNRKSETAKEGFSELEDKPLGMIPSEKQKNFKRI